MSETVRSGVITGFTFIGTTVIMFSPILYGGTTYLAPEAAQKDLEALKIFLETNGITHIFMPSGLAAALAEYFDTSNICIFAGGEKLRNFHPVSPNTRIYNSYGCTETGGTMIAKIRGDEEILPVGHLSMDAVGILVDEELHQVPEGEVGELLISCDRISHSYWKLPELSAEKWVFLDDRCWYRTGDRMRLKEDGMYYILGRTDNMVKLRGFRIETGEVETQVGKAFHELEWEVGAIAVVLKTVNGIDHLTCYYEAPTPFDTERICEEIKKVLAEYMIPDLWICLPAMPRNANGKVIRAELPQPQGRDWGPGVIYSETESRLAEAVCQILKLQRGVDLEAGFTELGGTSIQAMQLASLLRQQGIRVTGAQVLRTKDLRELAKEAEVDYERFWSIEEHERIWQDFASRNEKIEKVLPITSEQDEMLFDQIIYPDHRKYHKVFMLPVSGLVKEESLRYALDVVAKENEELRAAVVYRKVCVIQQVITDRQIPLYMYTSDSSDALEEVYKYLMDLSFDLQTAPTMRVVCMHKDGESFLYVWIHRIFYKSIYLGRYLLRLMEILGEEDPENLSIMTWQEVLKMSIDETSDFFYETSLNNRKAVGPAVQIPDDLYVYSEEAPKKMVFVHTGNSGSDVYYRLAQRMGRDISFSVIEPFNLYHPKEAHYGIKNLAAKYIEILKEHQPEGPYILGGWCYGGVVAHEMACQMEAAGEQIEALIMLDSHAVTEDSIKHSFENMNATVDRHYFETSPLFQDLRDQGMLDAMVSNAFHVSEDIENHVPSVYHGEILYFKPQIIPANTPKDSKEYWEKMMLYRAGNYENYCDREKLLVIPTPHEHDLMMDDESLDIIVPEIYKKLGI